MENEAVTITRENEWNLQRLAVIEPLLHTVLNGAVIVLRLDECDRDVIVVEDVIGELGFAARYQFSPNDYATLREIDLAPDLRVLIPSCLSHVRRNEFCADVRIAERLLIHTGFVDPCP